MQIDKKNCKIYLTQKSLNELNVHAKQLLRNITMSYIITNYKFI